LSIVSLLVVVVMVCLSFSAAVAAAAVAAAAEAEVAAEGVGGVILFQWQSKVLIACVVAKSK